MTFTKFQRGNIYEMRFIGDSELRVPYICVKRTAKTVILQGLDNKETLKKKINIFDGVEYIKAGTYSKAPTIYADRVIG